jgi:hypothetical protein
MFVKGFIFTSPVLDKMPWFHRIQGRTLVKGDKNEQTKILETGNPVVGRHADGAAGI